MPRTDTGTPLLGEYQIFQVPIENIVVTAALSMDQLVTADRYALQPAARLELERWTELAAYTDIVVRRVPSAALVFHGETRSLGDSRRC